MFISTIDYRQSIPYFTQDLSRLLPFNPLNCFAIHFKTILIWFLCILGFWSTSGLLFIPHWQGGFFIGICLVERSNEGVLILSNLELPALSYISPITAISGYQNIDNIKHRNHPVVLWEGNLSLSKAYKGPLGYAEGRPLTLYSHFIQLYRSLDTF